MKKFGFGFMRLPTLPGGGEGDIDYPKAFEMVDYFLSQGFTYFDIARGYMEGNCEAAFNKCVAQRYERDKYVLTDKLTVDYFKTREDILPLIENQLKVTGAGYFDYYFLHSVSRLTYPKFLSCGALEILRPLKEKGLVKHIGISYHDKSDFLDEILTAHPEIEVVQIQFNYADYRDTGIDSRGVYETARKHNKPVLVMEPVKGGILSRLPERAMAVISELNEELSVSPSRGSSPASYAIRFAASFEGIMMVLSGMNNLEQVVENTSFMKDFVPLNPREYEALEKVNEILKATDAIPCTNCRYCTSGCPQNIRIPDLFACLNSKRSFNEWGSEFNYEVNTASGGKASDCIDCGQCEDACPQHLEIRSLLREVAEVFEKKEEENGN